MIVAAEIHQIKQQQEQLATRIAAVEAEAHKQGRTAVELPAATLDLEPGEVFAGMIISTDPAIASHYLILLPGEAESVDWEAAKTWASRNFGELPTRQEQALLFANCKAQFKDAYYWSSEHASNSDYAWGQYFGSGDQGNYRKDDNDRARAVRRLSI